MAKRMTEQRRLKILRETETTPVAKVAKKYGVSDVTIYAWRKRHKKPTAAAAPPQGRHAATRNKARAAVLREFGLAANIPPARGQRTNGDARPREPNLEGALIHLQRAENWIIQAKFTGELRELDPAHREMIQARGALLGLAAP